MQQLLAALVTSLSVRDAGFNAGMATARKEAARTGQDVERSADQIENAVVRMAQSADRAMIQMVDAFESARRKMVRAGAALTVGLSIPLLLAGKASKDTAATFEASMNAVRSAMVKASPEQIKALSDAAMEMGPRFGKSASEAAAAIEGLAKAGLSASDILNGGLKSALTMSVVGQTDLGRATAITTDIMSQFSREAGDLPAITDRVVGALDATKLAADDYAQAIGQVGGIAGGLGYSFEDTNVAISALAPAFDSGSSAGTALKAMLLQLKPTTKDAARVFNELGKATIGQSISFFDAQGNAKSFAETAEILRRTFGQLNEESKRQALSTAFGSDGMAAAIALMKEGAAGMDDMARAIDSVTAGEKLSVLMQGDVRASENLANAVDALSIKLGNVLLPIFTALKNAAASVIQWLADLPPSFHAAWVAAGALTAALGPLIAAIGVALPAAFALLAGRLVGIPLLMGAIINPLGLLIGLIGRLAVAMGASAVIGTMAIRMASLASGIGLVVGIVTVLVPLLFRTAAASEAATRAQDAANAAMEKARDTTARLATATGKLRAEIIAKAREDGKAAAVSMKAAVADIAKARAALVRAKAEAAAQNQAATFASGSAAGPGAGAMMRGQAAMNVRQAEEELKASAGAVRGFMVAVQESIAAIKSPNPTTQGNGLAMDFDAEKERKAKGPKGKSAADRARDQAQYEDELGRLRVEALEARAELNGSIEARYDATMAGVEEDRARFARSLSLDDSLNATKRAKLTAAQDGVLAERALIAEQERSFALEQDRYDLAIARNDAMQDEVRGQIDAAESVAARRAGALRLLDLQRQNEEAVLDQIIATKKTTSIEYSNAMIRKGQLDGIYADRRAGVERDNRGPWGDFIASLPTDAAKANEALESVAANGVGSLIDGLATASFKVKELGATFKQIAAGIVADLLRIQLQKALVGAASNLLGGLLGGLGGARGLALPEGSLGLGSDLKAFTPDLRGLSYGGGKASGGRVGPGSWYMVGENGPEPFVPDSAGTIHPNSALRGGRAGALSVSVDASPLLMVKVNEAANTQATAVSINSQRTQAKRARNTMGSGRR